MQEQLTTPSRYATLDGLRGAAAIFVVVFHYPASFGILRMQNGYLLVDLFFLMSGFVIASAYDGKLATHRLGALQFMKLRLIRLYPLYILGTLLGVTGLLLKLPHNYWRPVALALPFALVMMPSPWLVRTFYPADYALPWLYPLNYPGWSLFFELLANATYAIFFDRLTTRRLISVAAVSGAMLIFVACHAKTLNNGPLWSRSYVGFVRIAYSFTIGILLFRKRKLDRQTSDVAAVALVAGGLLLLGLPCPEWLRPEFVAATVIVALPLLVWLAASIEPSSRLRWVFLFSGTISYGVYVLHAPVAAIGSTDVISGGQLQLQGRFASGAALLAVVIVLACIAEKFYDRPVRRFLLSGRMQRRRLVAETRALIND
jgi:peptidoglycan/LPS O-acetylase OafA/YrhL